MIISNLKLLNFWERDRRESFKSWPFDAKSPCNVAKMAEAGFFWSGTERENDTATCFTCGKVLDGWEKHDDPWKEHVKHAPQCIFVKFHKPEVELTIDELLQVMEVVIKATIARDHEQLKKSINKAIEDKRKEFLNQL